MEDAANSGLIARDARLDVPPIPDGFEYWVVSFMEMRRGGKLTYEDIMAYVHITGIKITPVFLSALLAMEDGALRAIDEVIKENKNG